MTTTVKLLVNDNVIPLDYFAAEFVHRVVNGIVQSLRGTCEIDKLRLTINGDNVDINLNNAQVPANPFVQKISRATVIGMVSTLKGVNGVEKLELTIVR